MWDNKRPFSKLQFQRAAAQLATLYFKGERSPVVRGKRYLPQWWAEREIRIFWEPGISDETVRLIVEMLERRATELGLEGFIFKLFGAHSSALGQLSTSLVGRDLDEKRLFELMLTEEWRDESLGGCQHGDVLITRKQFLGDAVSWGAAAWTHGAMVFALHGDRQHDHSYLKKVALHEANHLFGMPHHCETFQNVDGFAYTPRCNMHYSCPSENLCPKCVEFVQHWWLQIERECGITA